MLLKKICNISFRKKLTLIFIILCILTTCIGGILYYSFAEREIVDNFTKNAESLANQLGNTLDARLEVVNRKAFAALTNDSFIPMLTDYLEKPDLKKEVKLEGEAARWLKDIRMTEPLIHSVFLYTDKGSWDDFTEKRIWEFNFWESSFGKIYSNPDVVSVQWMPAMQNEIFKNQDKVIPYVRRFYVQKNGDTSAFLIIQLDQEVLLKEVIGDSVGLGEILITDKYGQYITGTSGIKEYDLEKLNWLNENIDNEGYCGDVSFRDNDYLMYKGKVEINNWRIYILKSKAELLERVGQLRNLIVGMSAIMIGLCLVLATFLSRQLTSSLQQLALQMDSMREGNLDARYDYPYNDEIGSLAKTFNYMADQIEESIVKQEEYIALLKEERDFVEYVQKQKRKAEIQALQAQINPHFLYNTLNTITWMAADKGIDEIRILSNSLGKFFRISLSRGAEAITVRDEIEHVKSYLNIQEVRYSEIMNYHIDVPEELMQYKILKLVLQPLVENSIYHGIKEKGTKSHIWIRAEIMRDSSEQEYIQFKVEDDGVGITSTKLSYINETLKNGMTDNQDGYGIFNVNERIKLYYGEKFGLHFESKEGNWTKAILTVPLKR